MKKTLLNPVTFTIIAALSLSACGSDPVEEPNTIDEDVFDPNSALNTVFDGKIFSIPSPIETAYLIKDLELEFNESMLNTNSSVNSYVTEYQQALNLGIYGADLGYTALYDQKGVSMRYLSSVEKLTSQLGLSAAFDSSFLMRFEKNSENEDSMILLMSDSFGHADNFLKKSDRKQTSALVLTGGWIESFYFACELYKVKAEPKLLRRIGEQKETLNSIIELLGQYNDNNKNDELLDQLTTLKESFGKIDMTYMYEAPETDAENRTTTLNNTLEIVVTPAVMDEVRTKITGIRANIIKG